MYSVWTWTQSRYTAQMTKSEALNLISLRWRQNRTKDQRAAAWRREREELKALPCNQSFVGCNNVIFPPRPVWPQHVNHICRITDPSDYCYYSEPQSFMQTFLTKIAAQQLAIGTVRWEIASKLRVLRSVSASWGCVFCGFYRL